jgi:hypothetical protein
MFLPFIVLRGQIDFIFFFKKDLYQDQNVILQIFKSKIC